MMFGPVNLLGDRVTHGYRSASRQARQILSDLLFLAGIGTAAVVLVPFYGVLALRRRVSASAHSPSRFGHDGLAGR